MPISNQPPTRPTYKDPEINKLAQDLYNKLQQSQQQIADLQDRVFKLEHP